MGTLTQKSALHRSIHLSTGGFSVSDYIKRFATKEKPEEKTVKAKHVLNTRGVQAEIRRAVEETKKGKEADENNGESEKVNTCGSIILSVDCKPPSEERSLSAQTIRTSDTIHSSNKGKQQENETLHVIDVGQTCAKLDHGKTQDIARDVDYVATTQQKMRLEEYTSKTRVRGKSDEATKLPSAPGDSVPSQQVATQETISVTREKTSCDLAPKSLKGKSSSLALTEAEGSRHLPGKFIHSSCHQDGRTDPVEVGNIVKPDSKQVTHGPKEGKLHLRFHKSSEVKSKEQSIPKCTKRPETTEKEQGKGAEGQFQSCTDVPRPNKEPDSSMEGKTCDLVVSHKGTQEIDPVRCQNQPTDSERQDDTNSVPGAQDSIVVDDSPSPAAPFDHRIVSVKQAPLSTSYSVCQDHLLGGGRFGQVHRCAEMSSGLTLAAKIIKVKSAKDREEVKNEINIMNQLNHVNLIQLYDAFECKNSFTLILEYVDGGELFDRIADENYNLTELDAILFAKQICEGVYYLHQQYILHLDLKPENILCVSHTGNQIKIIDFGLARRYKPREKLKVNFGTPEFLAPEVVNYDFVSFPTDMWSVGVITYMLLSGLSPFLGENDTETMNYIVNCNWDFNAEAFEEVSEEGRDFISQLLVKEKSCRISAAQCLKHAWLNDLPAKAKKSKVRLKSQVLLQKYLAHRKWKKHFYVVTAAHRFMKFQQMAVNPS
ncbi:myosin light chain kinase 3 isoform X2 [Lissotriton helveticus]